MHPKNACLLTGAEWLVILQIYRKHPVTATTTGKRMVTRWEYSICQENCARVDGRKWGKKPADKAASLCGRSSRIAERIIKCNSHGKVRRDECNLLSTFSTCTDTIHTNGGYQELSTIVTDSWQVCAQETVPLCLKCANDSTKGSSRRSSEQSSANNKQFIYK